MEPQWLTYGKRLQAIASSGLHFARDQFDRERYEEIASIANEMLADLGSVPIERIEGLPSLISRRAMRHRKSMCAERS
ncbi:NUDIX hydrolase N-terminal domain-containing protein [Bradyrhizobium sp. LM2.9]